MIYIHLNLVLFSLITTLHVSSSAGRIYDVIVVGGGVSGLSTCVHLFEQGIENILLIEADSRLGGRINTINYGNGLIELGAQFIHGGTNKNPIYSLMNSLHQIDPDPFYNKGSIYSATQDSVKQNEAKVDFINTQIQSFFSKEIPASISANQSMGNLFDKYWKQLLGTKLANYNKRLANAVYKSKLDDMISDYACNTFYELSAKGFSQYANFEGEEFTNLKNGYIQLINYLKSKLPNTVIKLGEPVSNVNYTEDIVQVSTPKSIYQAKYVVMTVSLGILKSKYNTLFTPALPDAKISAINRLGFGVVNKLFYVFEKPVFDDPDISGVQFLWTNDTDFKLSSNLRCNLSAKFSQFYKSFNVLTVPPKRRNIFFSFFTGENSIYSESLSDECLIDVMNDLLTKFFPQFNIPRPKALVRSKWSSNPFVKGSYSFTKVGSTMTDTKTLAKPVENKLFFAGEATTSYIGTVHGGYMTGTTVAKKLQTLIEE